MNNDSSRELYTTGNEKSLEENFRYHQSVDFPNLHALLSERIWSVNVSVRPGGY